VSESMFCSIGITSVECTLNPNPYLYYCQIVLLDCTFECRYHIIYAMEDYLYCMPRKTNTGLLLPSQKKKKSTELRNLNEVREYLILITKCC
jgi:hypothetical protein